jgi:hypothetical protein
MSHADEVNYDDAIFKRSLAALCGRLGVSKLFFLKNEDLNYEMTEYFGYERRFPLASSFE